MADIRSYRDLVVWKQAMDFSVAIYDVARDWPREELYGLTSQARRASVSIAANIAEGYGRESLASYINFLKISQGSLKELETLMLLAERLGYTSEAGVSALLEQGASIGKLLRLLMRKLEASQQ